MTNVRKVVDSNILQQFKAMQSDLLRLGTVITMSYSSLVQIVVIAGQADIARQELLHFSEGAAKMRVNFDMNSIQAGTAMNQHAWDIWTQSAWGCHIRRYHNHLSNNMGATAASIINIGHTAPFNRDDRAAVRSLKLYLPGA